MDGKLHLLLYEAFVKCFPDKSKVTCQQECNKFRKESKTKYGTKELFVQEVNKKIEELRVRATEKKSANILRFFSKSQQAASSTPRAPAVASSSETTVGNKETAVGDKGSTEVRPSPSTANVQPDEVEDEEGIDDPVEGCGGKRVYSTPAQDKSRQHLNALKARLNCLLLARQTELAPSDCEKQIKNTREAIHKEELKLKRREKDAERKRKSRTAFQSNLSDICAQHPEVAKRLKHRDGLVGRPPLETDQPGLLATIEKIATFGGGAEARRRSELIRSCRALDDLTDKLKSENFMISRSATYLRLLPKRSNAGDGKRHVHTVPVKLVKASADEHKSHQDTTFAVASIRQLEALASIMGPKQTFFLSQDDKARVPLGITAANKQAPLLMNMEYRVRLPDHDFVVADKHKLIPSVYAAVIIKPQGMGASEAVTYSGPTYVAIRSGKHSSSTAGTHAADLKTVVDLEEFKEVTRTEIGSIKPIFIVSVDGGPDENPRSKKVMTFAIRSFRDMDLDAVFIVTNAPGRSAYNRVERRMAPLSGDLSGLILPYDYFGNHLDSQRRTIDPELELDNFGAAARVLAEIWSATVIDGHPVVAVYVAPGRVTNNFITAVGFADSHVFFMLGLYTTAEAFLGLSLSTEESEAPELPGALWLSEHVRQSQYLLQVRKCTKSSCCGNRRSNLRSILPDGFLPPPLKVLQNEEGFLQASEDLTSQTKFLPLFQQLALRGLQPPSWGLSYSVTPYDLYCPSVQLDLTGRCCVTCSLYHPSKKAAQDHEKAVGHGARSQASRVRPVRVRAKRRGELLCELEGPALDWMEEEDVDVEGVESLPGALEVHDVLPVTEPLEEWVTSPWTDVAGEA